MIDTLKKRVAREESGFTLIELLVVIIILGILLAIAVPSYLGLKDRADKSASMSNVRAVVPDVEQYNADHNNYSGVTATNLQASYDQAIDTAKIHVFSMTAGASYCIWAQSGKYIATKVGPAGQIGASQGTAVSAACVVS